MPRDISPKTTRRDIQLRMPTVQALPIPACPAHGVARAAIRWAARYSGPFERRQVWNEIGTPGGIPTVQEAK